MYTFSKKLKTTALILMALGLVGIVYGFLAAPNTVEEAEKIVAASHHGEHKAEGVTHDAKALELPTHEVTTTDEHAKSETTTEVKDTLVEPIDTTEAVAAVAVEKIEPAHESEAEVAKEHKEHVEHVFHQLQK